MNKETRTITDEQLWGIPPIGHKPEMPANYCEIKNRLCDGFNNGMCMAANIGCIYDAELGDGK